MGCQRCFEMKFFRFLFDDNNLNSNRKRIFFKQKTLTVKRCIGKLFLSSVPDKNICTGNVVSACVGWRFLYQNSGCAQRTRIQNPSGVLFGYSKVAVRVCGGGGVFFFPTPFPRLRSAFGFAWNKNSKKTNADFPTFNARILRPQNKRIFTFGLPLL